MRHGKIPKSNAMEIHWINAQTVAHRHLAPAVPGLPESIPKSLQNFVGYKFYYKRFVWQNMIGMKSGYILWMGGSDEFFVLQICKYVRLAIMLVIFALSAYSPRGHVSVSWVRWF